MTKCSLATFISLLELLILLGEVNFARRYNFITVIMIHSSVLNSCQELVTFPTISFRTITFHSLNYVITVYLLVYVGRLEEGVTNFVNGFLTSG